MSSPSFGLRTLAMRMDHLLGQAAQIVDHDQAEHDGNGPDFTDRQGGDCLVSLHEPCDVVLIEATIAVGDQLQGQRVNSRKARDRTVRQLREQFVVAACQVGAYLPQTIGYDVKVVQEPFRVGTETFPTPIGFADKAMCGQESAAVSPETGE